MNLNQKERKKSVRGSSLRSQSVGDFKRSNNNKSTNQEKLPMFGRFMAFIRDLLINIVREHVVSVMWPITQDAYLIKNFLAIESVGNLIPECCTIFSLNA